MASPARLLMALMATLADPTTVKAQASAFDSVVELFSAAEKPNVAEWAGARAGRCFAPRNPDQAKNALLWLTRQDPELGPGLGAFKFGSIEAFDEAPDYFDEFDRRASPAVRDELLRVLFGYYRSSEPYFDTGDGSLRTIGVADNGAPDSSDLRVKDGMAYLMIYGGDNPDTRTMKAACYYFRLIGFDELLD